MNDWTSGRTKTNSLSRWMSKYMWTTRIARRVEILGGVCISVAIATALAWDIVTTADKQVTTGEPGT